MRPFNLAEIVFLIESLSSPALFGALAGLAVACVWVALRAPRAERAVQDQNGRTLADDGGFDRASGRFDHGTVRFQALDLAIAPSQERRRANDDQ